MKSVLVAAGESSGEKYGADVVREFGKKWPACSFFGVGGKEMREAGVEIIFPVEELSAVGIFEVLTKLPHFSRLFRRLELEIQARKPFGALLIDSPDFNLRLAKKLHRLGIPVLYYISPTVWAWRSGRLKTIKKTVERMLLIFPFETRIYQARGIPSAFVGHPLKPRVRTRLSREEFLSKHTIPSALKLIALLPGSRRTEIKNHLPVLLDSVRRISEHTPARFLLVLAESIDRKFLDRFLPPGEKSVQILTEDGYEAIAYSDLALSACGTANLESALLGTPLVAFYRLSPLTYYPFRRLLKIRDYSIVNILAGRRIVPELIQRRFKSAAVAAAAEELLSSDEKRRVQQMEFRRLGETLGEARAAENVALELGKILKLC
jgi:lipid-A-disaccharide synthase